MLLVVGTVLGSFVLTRLAAALQRRTRWSLRMPPILLGVSDAVGLAAFTVVGVLATLETGVEPLWLWGALFAGVTAAGGGIIRDVVRSDTGNPLIKGEFYFDIAVIWGFALSLFLTMTTANPDPLRLELAVTLTIFGAFATRMAAIYFKVRSPLF